ncbi:hypothetical protein BGS_0634 [Beggiatoa sp. SS]|nr:hypothetical protein BGS_0634 [Beggiatoa sp. SS]
MGGAFWIGMRGARGATFLIFPDFKGGPRWPVTPGGEAGSLGSAINYRPPRRTRGRAGKRPIKLIRSGRIPAFFILQARHGARSCRFFAHSPGGLRN